MKKLLLYPLLLPALAFGQISKKQMFFQLAGSGVGAGSSYVTSINVDVVNVQRGSTAFTATETVNTGATWDWSEFYVMPESGAKVNISGLSEPVTESGTSFSLNETHRNKIVLCTNSGAITVTVNTGKVAGWNCMLVATHATGTISLTTSGTTINGSTSTTTQFETLSLVHYGSENYLSKLG